MKIRLKRCFKSVSAFLCAVLCGTAFPLQMAFASITAIPSGWWGCYDCSSNPRYIITIPAREKGTNITFKGRLVDYGEIAASNPSSIYFRPVSSLYRQNFTVRFEKYSTYNSSTRKYEPQYGSALFVANVNDYNSNIRILNGNGDGNYSKDSDVDIYKMYA